MHFIGVTTSQSSSLRMFPAWMQILGHEGRLLGVDIPLNAPPQRYHEAVQAIRDDAACRGALVTSHKINLYQAAQDIFDEISELARWCGEVSAIYKRGDRLIGHAVDPQSLGQALAHIVPDGYWVQSPAHLLCLGGGGAAVALLAHLAQGTGWPAGLHFVDRDPQRLAHLRHLAERQPALAERCQLHQHHNPAQNDALMASLPAGSLVINATGMGKDLPGSPITDDALFPVDGFVWELNYRGALDFYHQAWSQAEARRLTVVDGWYYFLVGWAAVVSLVFDVSIEPGLFEQMAASASAIRG